MENNSLANFFNSLYKRGTGPTSEQKVMLDFMEKTIERINYSLASLYATQSLLIKKGLITKSELMSELSEARLLPQTKTGRETLEKMLGESSVERLLDLVNLPDAGPTVHTAPSEGAPSVTIDKNGTGVTNGTKKSG